MSDKLLTLRQFSNFLTKSVYSKSETLLTLSFTMILLAVVIIFPKTTAKGDVTQDNTAGSWVGTLGPTQADVDFSSASLGINYNTSLLQYEAGLIANASGAYIRSSVITAPVGTFKKWKQLKLGIRRPTGTNTTISVDILCGDPAQPGPQCPTYNQPIPINGGCQSFANIALNASDEFNIPSCLTASKIKIRVNFTSANVTLPQIVLYNWQVSWEVNSGVNLTVSKTPNPANPVLNTGFDADPGVPNNNIVVYSLNYSLDRSVQNLKIELPYPAGTYSPLVGTPKTYTANYQGSSGGTIAGNVVTFSLGNLTAGTVGSVSATFKVLSGPPDGTIFKTKAKIYGNDYSAVTLPDDLLNISSKGFMFTRVISPEVIAANLEVNYLLQLGDWYYWWQSDLFNARYEFVYSSCLDVNSTVTGPPNTTNYPKVFGSGATWSHNPAQNKVTITPSFSPLTSPPNLVFGITLKARAAFACSGAVLATVTFYSEQDASFVKNKVTNGAWNGGGATSTWSNGSSTALINIWKDGGPNPTGAGQKVDYLIHLTQRSNVPVTNFYVVDQIPAQTTFVSANISPGGLYSVSAIPKNWKIYWSSTTSSGPWTELLNGPVPCSSGGCKVPAGQEGNVKYIKYESTTFNWDRNTNYAEPLANLSVVTDTSASGTITNNIISYASNTCITGCSDSYDITISNAPGFEMQYKESNAQSCVPPPSGTTDVVVESGDPYCTVLTLINNGSNTQSSHGDASNVNITIRVPSRSYLTSTYNPLNPDNDPTPPSVEVYARCLMPIESSNCPDVGGTIQSNPSFLNPNAASCSSGTLCTVSWSIPKIYSTQKYPYTYPTSYRFYVRVNTRLGIVNQTEICATLCRVSALTSTPAHSNTNINSATTNKVTISSSVNLTMTKVHNPPPNGPTTLNCATGSQITYRITYQHSGSSGSVDNLYVMDALPEITTVVPNAKLIYKSQSNANAPNTTGYFLTNFSRSGNPPSSDTSGSGPGWQLLTSVAGQEELVDWVMWKKTATYNYNAAAEYVLLTLKDQQGCSPNGTIFTNRGFVSYDANTASPASQSVLTTIVNPGFSATTGGSIGSKLGFSGSGAVLPPSCGSVCTATYALISGSGAVNGTPATFNSLKSWVLDSYSLPETSTLTNYAEMFKDYGRDAVACTNETSCFGGSEKVKIFTASSGNPFKINTPQTYSGTPRILFVNQPTGSGGALEINTNFAISQDSALIFVVNGDVKVNYGVTSLDGVYLVEGQFDTGRRGGSASSVKEAGQYAAISIGRDGFARIAYLSGDNIRFIRCKDLDCQNRDYGYVTTAANVRSINMVLYEDPAPGGLDYPKIVVGMQDSDGVATTKYIGCKAANCLDVAPIVNTYNNAKDPDVIMNAASIFGPASPSYVMGSGSSSPRPIQFFWCTNLDCPNPNPLGDPIAPIIDGGPGDLTSSPTGTDKGNEISSSLVPATGSLHATYVDRSPGKSDLWFTRFRWDINGNGNCPSDSIYLPVNRWWDCKKLVTGNVGLFPSSYTDTTNSITKIFYTNTSTKQIIYLECSDTVCSTVTTNIMDCGTAPACAAQDYVSSAGTGSNLTYVLYNTKNPTTGNNNEVKLGLCVELFGTCGLYKYTYPISNIPGSNITANAKSYTQSIALGRVTEAGFPRIVFYDEVEKKLWYARCRTSQCESAANINFRFIDDGTPVALPDKQLTVNGMVTAYGNNVSAPATNKALLLQRDLFSLNTSQPGETFNLEAKYFYLLKDIIKPPEYIREDPP